MRPAEHLGIRFLAGQDGVAGPAPSCQTLRGRRGEGGGWAQPGGELAGLNRQKAGGWAA